MMADLERELKLEYQQPQQQIPQQEPSPSAVMAGSGTGFTFSRASSIGSVNAVSCSSASSTHNTGNVLLSFVLSNMLTTTSMSVLVCKRLHHFVYIFIEFDR